MRSLVLTPILAVIVVAQCLVSCHDSFDADSPSRMDASRVYANADLAEQALYGIYAKMTEGRLYTKKLSMYMSLNSDTECISGSTDNGRRAIARYVATSGNTESKDVWEGIYEAIRECNNFIEGCKASDLLNGASDLRSQHKMRRLLAEGIILRSMLYHDIVRLYGDVPFVLSSSDDDYKANVHRRDILSYVIEESLRAVEDLDAPSGDDLSFERIHKLSAQAMIARWSMTRAGASMLQSSDEAEPRFPDDRNQYLSLAADQCKAIIDSRHYQLSADYQQIWQDLLSYSTISTEMIFCLPMTRGASSELGYFMSDKHDDGSPYGSTECGVLIPPTHYYRFMPQDLRRDVSCTLHKYSSSGVQSLAGIINISAGKYRREWLVPVLAGKQKYTGVDIPVMRYADVLLIRAEALAELYGLNDESLQLIREVRSRAFAASDTEECVDSYLAKITTSHTLIQAIRNERALEFTTEMVRKYDLMRWGTLGSTLAETQAALTRLKNRTDEYNNIPEKIVWRISSDGETAEYATTDNYHSIADFDYDSEGMKNTKWAANVSDAFITRIMEADGIAPYFLPHPE